MRPTARNAVLALFVLVLGVANVLLVQDRSPTTEVVRLFPALEPTRVVRVVVTAPDGASVTLARGEDDTWTLAERFGWRAYQPAVEALLRGLASATTAEREATNKSSHVALGIDEKTGNRLRVEAADGQVLAELLQAAPPEGTRGSRLLPGGQDSVYRAPTVPRVVPDPARWIDPDVLPFDANDVQAFSFRLTLPDGELVDGLSLERRADGRFALPVSQRMLAPAVVDPFLKALESVVARDVVSAPELSEAGINGPPQVTLAVALEEIEGASSTSVQGWFGVGYEAPFELDPPEGGAIYACMQGFEQPDGEKRWFALPALSGARLIALAQRMLAAAND